MGKGYNGSSQAGKPPSLPRPTTEDAPGTSESSPPEVSQSVKDCTWPDHDHENDSEVDVDDSFKTKPCLSDSNLISHLYTFTCEEKAHMFSTWVDSYTPETKRSLGASHQALTELMAKIVMMLKEAERDFRKSEGASEPIVLRPIEAIAILQASISSECTLKLKEEKARMLQDSLDSRNEMISNLVKLNKSYQKKVQDLMLVCGVKKYYLLKSVLQDKASEATEIAALKVKCDLQTHKVDLLEEELALIAVYNCAAHKELENLDEYIHRLEGPKCHNNCLGPNKVKHDSLHWHGFEKDIGERKRAVLKAIKNEVRSQIDYQILTGTKDRILLELLFDHVIRSNSKEAVKICQLVYGDTIEIIPEPLVLDSNRALLRAFSSAIKSKTGADIRRELSSSQQEETIDSILLKTSFKNYLPPTVDNSEDVDPKWTTSDELVILGKAFDRITEENTNLMQNLAKARRFTDSATADAKSWREHYDLHMSNCKEHIAKEQSAKTELHVWINKTVGMLCPNVNMAMSEKAKISKIEASINIIIKERDDALRKNEPLMKKLRQKDKSFEDKSLEFSRSIEANRAHEETLKKSITSLESKIVDKELNFQKAKRDADKVRDEWQKKLQRSFDKMTLLEQKFKAKTESYDFLKLDLDATQTQLDSCKTKVASYQTQLEEQSSQLDEIRQESDQKRSALLALRSNERIESDRIKAAVRDAEAPKNAEITELKGKIVILNNDRRVDENNIRELSRWKEENFQKNQEIIKYRTATSKAQAAEKSLTNALQKERTKSANLELQLQAERDNAQKMKDAFVDGRK